MENSTQIFKDKKTSYKILTSKNADAHILRAAQELVKFIKKSTDTILEIITDNSFKKTDKVISLGKNELSNALSIKLPLEKFGSDGFMLKVENENIYILANDSLGVLFGTYGFLERAFKIKFFAEDEISVPKLSDVYLNETQIIDIPDFTTRALGINTNYSQDYEKLIKINYANGGRWITWAHTHFSLIPPEKYHKDHPDWYSPDLTQLCLNGNGLVLQMVENICSLLTIEKLSTGTVHYVMVGHEDVGTFCTCEKCIETNDKYGGAAGTMMLFINQVAKGVNEWVAVNRPDKIIKIVTFGYGLTVKSPTIKKDGKHIVVDQKVKAEKNVCVMLAPLGSDWLHSLIDEKYNQPTKESLYGWQAVGAELFIWTYSSVFDDNFVFINHWKHLQESYQIFKKFGASYIFDQGHSNANLTFDKLSIYMRSQLMWSADIDFDKKLNEFFSAYYKNSSAKVKEYFDSVIERYSEFEKQLLNQGEILKLHSYVRKTPHYRSRELWTQDYLEKALLIFDQAIEQALSIEDAKLKTKVLNRVKCERLSPLYLYLEFYAHTLDKQKLKKLINEFAFDSKTNNINYYAEWGERHTLTIENKLIKWRSLLNEVHEYV